MTDKHEPVAYWCGKRLEDMTREELIEAMHHLAALYDRRVREDLRSDTKSAALDVMARMAAKGANRAALEEFRRMLG